MLAFFRGNGSAHSRAAIFSAVRSPLLELYVLIRLDEPLGPGYSNAVGASDHVFVVSGFARHFVCRFFLKVARHKVDLVRFRFVRVVAHGFLLLFWRSVSVFRRRCLAVGMTGGKAARWWQILLEKRRELPW